MRRLAALLVLLPALALGQTAVTIFTQDTVQSGCVLGALNAACTIAMKGKSTVSMTETAASSPVLTITPEVSADGANWVATNFDDPSTAIKVATLANPASGTVRTLYMAGGMMKARVRVSAYTSGSITTQLTASQTDDPTVGFSGPAGALGVPPVVALVGSRDATTATTVNPLVSGANDTNAIGNGIETQDAVARATPTAVTAGRSEKLQVSTTNGGVFANIVGGAGVLPVSVQPTNTAARVNGIETLPGVSASAVAATTAGRGVPLAVDNATGFAIVNIGDATTFTKASVLANDTTAAANGLGVQPAIARATPTATTAGRAEMLQVETATGGLFTSGVATTAATGTSTAVVSVNTTTNVKASAGNVYGVSCSNANASACFLQFYNTAGSPTCGTSVVWSLALPTSGTLTIPPGVFPMANHATGIGVCMGTTATGATACTTANACTVFFK